MGCSEVDRVYADELTRPNGDRQTAAGVRLTTVLGIGVRLAAAIAFMMAVLVVLGVWALRK